MVEPAATPRVLSGRYELSQLVARGGMAEVYRARDHLLDRPVAVKILFPELSVDRSFVERFRREAQAAANLSHPSIVPVFDWGEDGGTYFIVMELVEGRALSSILRGAGPLHPDRAAEVASDVASAAGVRTPPRRDPPRREAGERPHNRRRCGEGHRLRDRACAEHRGEPHPDRSRHGNGHVLLPRASRGHGCGRAKRHLLARRRALRDGDRSSTVPRGYAGCRRVEACA